MLSKFKGYLRKKYRYNYIRFMVNAFTVGITLTLVSFILPTAKFVSVIGLPKDVSLSGVIIMLLAMFSYEFDKTMLANLLICVIYICFLIRILLLFIASIKLMSDKYSFYIKNPKLLANFEDLKDNFKKTFIAVIRYFVLTNIFANFYMTIGFALIVLVLLSITIMSAGSYYFSDDEPQVKRQRFCITIFRTIVLLFAAYFISLPNSMVNFCEFLLDYDALFANIASTQVILLYIVQPICLAILTFIIADHISYLIPDTSKIEEENKKLYVSHLIIAVISAICFVAPLVMLLFKVDLPIFYSFLTITLYAIGGISYWIYEKKQLEE